MKKLNPNRKKVPPRIPEGEAIEDHEEMSMEELNRQFKKRMREYNHFAKYILNDLNLKDKAKVLEIGPGPAWISIILVKENPTIHLTGLEISDDMIRVAKQNVSSEHVEDNITFVNGNANNMYMFENNSFDAAISHDSLHHWEDPTQILNEIERVLKKKGILCIADGRRDLCLGAKIIFTLMKLFISKIMSYYWKTSIMASYTPNEVKLMLDETEFKGNYAIEADLFDIVIHNK
jgi:ubiquinone/menaquinone biosynthesis C-methylase UbiE